MLTWMSGLRNEHLCSHGLNWSNRLQSATTKGQRGEMICQAKKTWGSWLSAKRCLHHTINSSLVTLRCMWLCTLRVHLLSSTSALLWCLGRVTNELALIAHLAFSGRIHCEKTSYWGIRKLCPILHGPKKLRIHWRAGLEVSDSDPRGSRAVTVLSGVLCLHEMKSS